MDPHVTGGSERLRIVLSNSYGTLNVGDEAILSVLVRELVDRGHTVDILTFTPEATGKRQAGAGVVRSGVLRGAMSTFNAIRQADLLVVGGGGIIQDSTSLGNLLFHMSRTWMARLARTPYALCGVGIGPLRRSISRRLTASACRHARSISVRDRKSAELLADIGIKAERAEITADLAHLLAVTGEHATGAIVDSLAKARQQGRRLIGLSLRPPVGNAKQRSAYSAEFEETFRAAADVAKRLVDEHAAHIVFVSMHPDQDDAIGERLLSSMPVAEHITVVPGKLSPGAIKSIVAELDLLIGARLHSVIFAASERVPAIGLAYDAKVAAYLGSLGLAGQVVEDADWDAGKIVELALETLDRSAAIKEELDRAVPELVDLARHSIAELYG